MSSAPLPIPPPDPAQTEEQLYLYAQELHDLYRTAKEEREALAEERLVLQYRLKELSSLNRLFQGHLERLRQVEEALREVVAGMRQALAGPLSKKTRGQLEELLSRAEGALSEAGAEAPAASSKGAASTGP